MEYSTSSLKNKVWLLPPRGSFRNRMAAWTKASLGAMLVIVIFTSILNPATAGARMLRTVADITGKVTDEKGESLPGVSVVLKGTQQGTVTDVDGKFKLSVADVTDKILVFSFVGYDPKEVEIGSQTNFSVNLTASTSTLNELVVVGYGEQKKVNLTGSVATIDSKSIESRPVTNLSSSLAGLGQGVYVRQGSGKPGDDGATIRIRGTGTLNDNSPLVLIDGIIGVMDAVNPNDVENISILKDAASSAIYGSQAANGVILITTKKGSKNRTTVSYSGLFSTASPSALPEFVSDYPLHMRLFNEGAANIGRATPIYSAQTIQTWEDAKANPNGLNANGAPNWLAYPNTNWGDVIFENNMVQNHNLSVNGGSDKALFNISLGYLDNPGVMQNTGLKRYQLRANVQATLAKFITIGTQTFAQTQSKDLGNTGNAFNFLRQTVPGVYPYYDGRYGQPSATDEIQTANNILTYLNSTGGDDRESRFNTTLFANFDILKGLKFETKLNYQMRFAEYNSHAIPLLRWNFANNIADDISQTNDPTTMSTSYSFNKNYQVTFDNVLRYNTILGKDHDIGALAGYNQYYYNYYDLGASKMGLIDWTITTLGSATDLSSISGQEYDRSMRSWFGRVNYAFRSKYLFEANVRYDGSSRFSPQTRWGTFPSFSAGWRISEERFFRDLGTPLTNLKLRASWGKLGNNASGDYDYQATYGKVGYSFNGAVSSGLVQGKIANPLLKWETTTVTNVGVDANAFNNRANIELEWYQKYTDGILTTPPIPITAGTVSAPTQNTAAVRNRGLELSLGWRDKIGEFNYSVSGNFAYNINKVMTYKGKLREQWVENANGTRTYTSNLGEVSTGGDNQILEGYAINEFYLRERYKGDGSFAAGGDVNINSGPKDGMIRTPEDLAWVNAMKAAGYSFSPVNGVGKSQLYYGDFIFADLNGDGIYGNSYDRKFTGTTSTPRYIFGLTLNGSWKGFDLSMLWAGSTGMQYYYNAEGYNNSIVRDGNGVSVRVADDHYYYNDVNPSDPGNNISGTFPRLKYNGDAINNTSNTFWLYDASYVKLKNLQLGYSIPDVWVKKAKMSRARIFLSGENLLILTKYPGLDPEIGSGVGYPTMKQYSLGVNVTF
ncbi:SusC/RagA family TonB-linked outer membrane protein [Dyadobacter psychrotolerans]|uniref:TonB-dependent receptor n=1 Tax=Dyadobacter psychrotolerans TaxID=2541721 RepID=A0A4R5E0S2_9BACT|nr:TonB-dependent receptor [Dyadobacter psychrotolerans]TDE17213.1 TonB-dependent receptor [Dyadobacter psychrotolerans]